MSTLKNKRIYALYLALTLVTGVNDALANTTIQAKAVTLQVIPAPTPLPTDRNCLACHTTGRASAGLANLKSGYQSAYRANPTTLANLKTLLNTLPATTVGSANSGLAKTDIYEVICTSSAVSLGVTVKDLLPVKSPTVSTQIIRGNTPSTVSNDSIDGDNIASPAVKLVGGGGAIYYVKINKSAYTGTATTNLGAETYTAQLACRNSANGLTGLAWRILQNQ